jgi:hypothetical protein
VEHRLPFGALGIELMIWVTSRDHDASVVEQDGFTAVHAGDRCGTEDGESLAALLGRVIEESLEVGSLIR